MLRGRGIFNRDDDEGIRCKKKEKVISVAEIIESCPVGGGGSITKRARERKGKEKGKKRKKYEKLTDMNRDTANSETLRVIRRDTRRVLSPIQDEILNRKMLSGSHGKRHHDSGGESGELHSIRVLTREVRWKFGCIEGIKFCQYRE